ncbi:hypothetical protein H4F33_17485 [Pectobacterium brasiliense]|nr:hypothetical protein [Pectobacterium brasiliense]MBN3073872.1 hypothetical protein [Pectobacterium brasiliense]
MKGSDEFPVGHEVFSPLRTAFETLLSSAKILDAVFSSEWQTLADELAD